MKYLIVLTFAIILCSLVASAPYDYTGPQNSVEEPTASSQPASKTIQKTPVKIVKSNSYESATNPLENKKYEFIQADCQNLGNDVEKVGTTEFKIRKFGCVYPGDKPIPQDLLQSVNEHVRTRLQQWVSTNKQ